MNKLIEDYQEQLGSSKVFALWQIYKSDTREGLYNNLSRWILQSERELLQNFFHSRQSGAKIFDMKEFLSLCRQMEEHLQAGGGVEIVNSRLSKISNLFEEESKQVEIILNKKGIKDDKISK